jgi:hypothetical protein
MSVAIAVARHSRTPQPDDDEERRDLRDEGDVAGDEDHRAVLADGAGEGEREAGEQRRHQGRQDDASGGAEARLAPSVAEASSTSRSISSSTGCTVRTTKGRPMKTSAMTMPTGV